MEVDAKYRPLHPAWFDMELIRNHGYLRSILVRGSNCSGVKTIISRITLRANKAMILNRDVLLYVLYAVADCCL